MTTTTTKTTRGALNLEAAIDPKYCGASLKITNAAPAGHREFRAAVLRIAAEVEDASEGERWIVHAERGESWGRPGAETRTARVWIECAGGTDEEEQRALATLLAVVAR